MKWGAAPLGDPRQFDLVYKGVAQRPLLVTDLYCFLSEYNIMEIRKNN